MCCLLWIKHTVHRWSKTIRERHWAECQKMIQKHLNYSRTVVLHEEDKCAQIGTEMVETTTAGGVGMDGWCKAQGEGQQSRRWGHQTDCCHLSIALTWQNALPQKCHYSYWPVEKADGPQTMTLNKTVVLLHPRCAQSAGSRCWVWGLPFMQFSTSFSKNKIFPGTRSFFRTGSALLRKSAKILQQGYHLWELNGGACTLQTGTVLMKDWGRPRLCTLCSCL